MAEEPGERRQASARQGATAVGARRVHLRPKDGGDADRVERELFLRESGRHEAAGRILGAGLICFALWTLFDANQLYHSALSSPEGARRTVSLTITRPIAKLSNALGLSLLVNWGDHMLDRGSGTPGAGAYHFPSPVVLPPQQPQIPQRSNGLTYPEVPGGRSVQPPPPDRLPPLPQPTAAHPLTILAIGDSIGQDLGYGLGDTFTGRPAVKVIQQAVESTGLARPDYYNWPAQLQAYLGRYHPGAVVVMLGANDEQALDENGHFVPLGSRAWAQDYASRVGAPHERGLRSRGPGPLGRTSPDELTECLVRLRQAAQRDLQVPGERAPGRHVLLFLESPVRAGRPVHPVRQDWRQRDPDPLPRRRPPHARRAGTSSAPPS